MEHNFDFDDVLNFCKQRYFEYLAINDNTHSLRIELIVISEFASMLSYCGIDVRELYARWKKEFDSNKKRLS